MAETIEAADLFCGGGGTSTGLLQAAEARGRKVNLTAVNHWDIAMDTHARNHPGARHLCQSIDTINPRIAIPGGKLDMLVASPECIFFSNARGARAMNEQGRATAWNILNWLDALDVRSLLVENVPEFSQWGPLYPPDHPDPKLRDRPIPEQRGKYFRNFLRNLRCLGYAVDWKLLTCADYGDPTTRRRLFLRGEKGARRVRYPDASHYPTGGLDLTGEKWIPARDIIDWTLPGESIFTRKRPLQPATLRRIEAGLQKFCGLPFLTIFRHNQSTSDVDEPLRTMTTQGANFALCQPFLLGQQSCSAPRSVESPAMTIATAGAISLTSPFLVPYYGENTGEAPRCLDLDQPLDTVTTMNRFGLCQPFLVGTGGPTGSGRPASAEQPLGAVLGMNHRAVCSPFLVNYNGTGASQSIDGPLRTVTTIDRFGLCQPVLMDQNGRRYLLDVLFRMLQPHELAAAHSFPQGYKFAGNKGDIVKQIGNSVPVKTARALCGNIIDRWAA